MTEIQKDITRSIPFKAIREGSLDKKAWFMWLNELEQILHENNNKATMIQPNLIIPLTIEGIYLRIILNGLRIEGVALYEKSRSYRICAVNNHKIFSTVMHDVHHINGLSSMQISVQEKKSLYV